MIHAFSYQDARGKYYYPDQVEERDGGWFVAATGTPVERKLEKMAKSKYNGVTPDEMCDQFGADALRLYELFMGPLEDSALWETSGVAGTRRFLDRAWRLVVDPETGGRSAKLTDATIADKELERALHAAIKKVTEAVTSMRFNTAIAEMMVFVNEATKRPQIPVAWIEAFVRILAPFAPHVAEELWEKLGHATGISFETWPAFDEAKLAVDTITVAVQVNGKLRGQVQLPSAVGKDDAIAAAKADPAVAKFLTGGIKREVYVPGRLVNFVVS
jgi:leucyl-tRNA synthetase